MAVTWTVSDLVKGVSGARRHATGTITASGTTSDDGDALAPSAIGLSYIEELVLQPSADSASNPENSFVPRWEKSTGKIAFYSQASAGATTPLAQITDGTTVTNYVIRFSAFGK